MSDKGSSFKALSRLPNDLVENCLAMLSIRYHPKFSVLLKKYNKFFTSENLYKIRADLNVKEEVPLIGLKKSWSKSLEWFKLETKLLDSEEMCRLQPVRPAFSDFNYYYKPRYVTHGSSIYGVGGPKIGGLNTDVYVVQYNGSVSKKLKSLDLSSGIRWSTAVGIVQDKIHVLGVYDGWCVAQEYNIEGSDSACWELFQIAYDKEFVNIRGSFVMLDKIFIRFDKFSCVYNPLDRTLQRYDVLDDHFKGSSYSVVVNGSSYCVIGSCLYVMNQGDTIYVFDSTLQCWSLLLGMTGILVRSSTETKLVALRGERLAILFNRTIKRDNGWIKKFSVSVFNTEKIDNDHWGHLVSSKEVFETGDN